MSKVVHQSVVHMRFKPVEFFKKLHKIRILFKNRDRPVNALRTFSTCTCYVHLSSSDTKKEIKTLVFIFIFKDVRCQ